MPDRAAPVALDVEARVARIVAGDEIARRARRWLAMRLGDGRGARRGDRRKDRDQAADRGAVEQLAADAVERHVLAGARRSRASPAPASALRRKARGCARRSRARPARRRAAAVSRQERIRMALKPGSTIWNGEASWVLRRVPAEAAEVLHQPEVAVVLRLGRPRRRVGVLGVVARHRARRPRSARARTPRPSRRSCRGSSQGWMTATRPVALRDRGCDRTRRASVELWAAAPARALGGRRRGA